MLRNYLTIALRTLRKHKGHTVINIVGLALGLAACLLIALYVRHEVSYDAFHERSDRLFQVLNVMREGDPMAVTPLPLGEALRADVPPIERLVRLTERSGVAKVDEASFETEVLYAGKAFFEMFSFPLMQGDPATALEAPDNLVLTTEKARMLFGTTEVVGRRLAVQLEGSFHTFTVSGVAEPAPSTSSIPLGVVVPFAKLEQIDDTFANPNWGTLSPLVFVQLPSAEAADDLMAQVPDFVQRHVPESTAEHTMFELLPITDVHLTPGIYGQLVPPSRPLYAYILGGIAAFILLIACINFITLASSRSAQRAREIGVRKTMGADRGQIMRQFWGEALLLCGGALVLGIGLARAALPVFNGLVGKELTAGALLRPEMGLVLLGLLIVVGLVAGGYPAVVLSRFRPVAVLRGGPPRGGSPRLVQGLVVVQFVLSIGLIVGTLAMWQQLDYVQSKELGFEEEHVVQVDARLARSEIGPLLERIRQVPQSAASVQHVTATWGEIAVEGALPNRFPTTSGGEEIRAHALTASHGVVETLGLTLKRGRAFAPEYGGDAQGQTVLVNEALVEAFGWDEPIGQRVSVRFNVEDAEVVGVVEDFHFQPLRQSIEPLVIHLRSMAPPNRIYARIAPGQTDDALDRLRAVWTETVPDLPFSFSFMDAVVDQQYRAEARWTRIVTYAAGFAIFIACLGLFGLATLAAQRRTQEIGIRKVLGASVASVVGLLTRDFLKWVAVAFVVAGPLGYWGVQQWLQNFAYRVDLGVWTFVAAGGAAGLVAIVAVGYQSIRAALTDPAEALRAE